MMEIFNSILLWYLFIITVSFFAVMIRFTAIDILKTYFSKVEVYFNQNKSQLTQRWLT